MSLRSYQVISAVGENIGIASRPVELMGWSNNNNTGLANNIYFLNGTDGAGDIIIQDTASANSTSMQHPRSKEGILFPNGLTVISDQGTPVTVFYRQSQT